MESNQELEMTNKGSMHGIAILENTDGEDKYKPNTETIRPETLKQDVNDFLKIEIDAKGPELAIENKEDEADVDVKIKMPDDTTNPGLVKQENKDVFEIKVNYIILGKGNGEKRYVCAICHERYGGTGNMKHHLLKRHDFVGPPKPIHKCTECQFKSGQISKVIKHMKNIHNSKELYSKCHICGYLCAQKFGLQEHINVMHFNAMKSCDYCEFKAKYLNKMQRHLVTSHQRVELKCRLCDVTYTSLGSHRDKFHSQKSCPFCKKTFKGAISLKDHKMKIHKATKHKEDMLARKYEYQKEDFCPKVNKKLVKVEFVPDSTSKILELKPKPFFYCPF